MRRAIYPDPKGRKPSKCKSAVLTRNGKTCAQDESRRALNEAGFPSVERVGYCESAPEQRFSVAISNIAGSVTSETAIVSAIPRPPVLTSQPASIAVTAGETAAFSVEVSGTNQFTIQWQRSNDAGATWFQIITQIGNVGRYGIVLTAAALADSGALFRAVVSNPGGAVTSQTATLTVS